MLRPRLISSAVARMLAVSAILAAGCAVSGTAAVAATPNETGTICSESTDYPHASSTPGKGADAKSRFSCSRGSEIVSAWLMNLCLCPQQPSGQESDWTSKYGCRVVAESNGINEHNQPFTVGAATVTRQVPGPGDTPVHGSGWWAACLRFTSNIYSGEQRRGAINPVRFSA